MRRLEHVSEAVTALRSSSFSFYPKGKQPLPKSVNEVRATDTTMRMPSRPAAIMEYVNQDDNKGKTLEDIVENDEIFGVSGWKNRKAARSDSGCGPVRTGHQLTKRDIVVPRQFGRAQIHGRSGFAQT